MSNSALIIQIGNEKIVMRGEENDIRDYIQEYNPRWKRIRRENEKIVSLTEEGLRIYKILYKRACDLILHLRETLDSSRISRWRLERGETHVLEMTLRDEGECLHNVLLKAMRMLKNSF